MGGRPHRAGCVVQDLGCHRSDEEAAKGADAVRWHHDQIDIVRSRELRDSCGWIATIGETIHPQTGEFIDKSAIEAILKIEPPFGHIVADTELRSTHVGRHRCKRRRDDAQETDASSEATSKHPNEWSSLSTLRREVIGKENVSKSRHAWIARKH
jgi:hypothetical protein